MPNSLEQELMINVVEESFDVDGRYREVDKELVVVPCQGCFWDFEFREGMLVPLEGEVAWILPEGRKPYWSGSIRRIEYEYAQ